MIVVHIGSAKAGSTTIQSFLNENEAALRMHSIEYPRPGRNNGASHKNIAFEIMNKKDLVRDNSDIETLSKHWKKSSLSTMIVSAEQLQGCDAPKARRLGAIRRTYTEEMRIVLVVRDHISLIPSSYAQKVKMGQRIKSFDDFFETRTESTWFDYAWVAQQWADAFGWESLRVRLLDPDYLINGDLIDDFLSQAGIDLGLGWVRSLNRPGSMNVTPGWKVVEAVRALYSGNAHLPGDHPISNAMQHSDQERRKIGSLAIEIGGDIGWNRDKGRYLTQAQAEKCHTMFERSIVKLNENLMEKLPIPDPLDKRGFVPRDEIPEYSQIPPSELQGFYDGIADRLVRDKSQRQRRHNQLNRHGMD